MKRIRIKLLQRTDADDALEAFNRIIESSPSLLTPFEKEIQKITRFLEEVKSQLPVPKNRQA